MNAVSVVIPYYNRERWLRDAVESVLNQTFSDFEIIVVDDGSEERPRFLEEVDDPRIRYVRQEHRGASAARNHGIRLAKGKYIAFLDADDTFLPEKLEVQVGLMDVRPDIPLSHTSYRRMDTGGNDLEEIRSGTFGGNVYPEIVKRCPIATPTVMIRRIMFAEEGLAFEESVRIGEDVILWIDVARRYEILGIDRTLTKVRIHGQNAFSDPEAQYRGSIEILRHAFRKDAGFRFSYRRRALAGVCTSRGHRFLEEGNRHEAWRSFARSMTYWPLDLGNLSMLLRILLPERCKPALRRLRDALRRGGERPGGNRRGEL